MRDGTTVVADEYVSAVPCDIFKRLLPKAWAKMPYFRQVDKLGLGLGLGLGFGFRVTNEAYP